jgi:hypothetical protein
MTAQLTLALVRSLSAGHGSPLIAPFAHQLLGGSVSPSRGHPTDFRRELLKRSARFHCKRLAQNFAVLLFSRAAVFGGAQLEAQNEFLIEVANN